MSAGILRLSRTGAQRGKGKGDMVKGTDPLERIMAEALESVERIERDRRTDTSGGQANPPPTLERGTTDVIARATFGPPSPATASSEHEPLPERTDTAAPTPAAAVEEPPAPTPRELELKDQLLRLAADFENFRRRSAKERDEIRRYGVEQVVRDLLPVVDNLVRALAHAETADAALVAGVEMVRKQFLDVLANYGVRAFESVGKAFDPQVHEALGHAPSAQQPPGSIVAEIQRGYMIQDRLLRAAQVMIACVAAPDESGTADAGTPDAQATTPQGVSTDEPRDE